MVDSGDQRRIDLLAKEVAWQLGHNIPCSQCDKPQNESLGWMMRRKTRGLTFECRGVKFWKCTNFLSSIEFINATRSLFPTEVSLMESALFLSAGMTLNFRKLIQTPFKVKIWVKIVWGFQG